MVVVVAIGVGAGEVGGDELGGGCVDGAAEGFELAGLKISLKLDSGKGIWTSIH